MCFPTPSRMVSTLLFLFRTDHGAAAIGGFAAVLRFFGGSCPVQGLLWRAPEMARPGPVRRPPLQARPRPCRGAHRAARSLSRSRGGHAAPTSAGSRASGGIPSPSVRPQPGTANKTAVRTETVSFAPAGPDKPFRAKHHRGRIGPIAPERRPRRGIRGAAEHCIVETGSVSYMKKSLSVRLLSRSADLLVEGEKYTKIPEFCAELFILFPWGRRSSGFLGIFNAHRRWPSSKRRCTLLDARALLPMPATNECGP